MEKIYRFFSMALGIAILFSNSLTARGAGDEINKEYRVESGGTELYLRVRGQDINKPVLLYLHGGPGESNGPLLFQAYAGPELENHSVVGYMHQRSTFLSPEAPLETLTLKQFVEDVDKIISFLKEEFHRDKILLLGHSFGGILGFMYLLEHQDNIEKFVSAGTAFSSTSLEENGYQTVMELAVKAGNEDAVEKLKTLGPPPYETLQKGMVWRMLGVSLLGKMNEGILKNFQMSRVMSVTGTESIDPKWQVKSMTLAGTMWSELITIDISDQVKNIGIPLLLLAGAKDIMVPFRIMKEGYDNYGGEKEYFILEKSNHMMFIDEPGLFVSKVTEFFQK